MTKTLGKVLTFLKNSPFGFYVGLRTLLSIAAGYRYKNHDSIDSMHPNDIVLL